MRKKTGIILLFLISTLNFAQEKEILSVMNFQADCWNQGNLECYMQGYWKSEKLIFIGKNGPAYGWETTLKNYKKSYPTAEKMGNLQFSDVKVDMLGKKYASVFGRWKLVRSDGNLSGIYTLIFQKFGKDWKIISDHTE